MTTPAQPQPAAIAPLRVPALCQRHLHRAHAHTRNNHHGGFACEGCQVATAATVLLVEMIATDAGLAKGLMNNGPLSEWQRMQLQAEIDGKGPPCCRIGDARFEALNVMLVLSNQALGFLRPGSRN